MQRDPNPREMSIVIKVRKTARSLFAVALLAAGFSIAAPANAAHATDSVECGSPDYLQVWGHTKPPLIVGSGGNFIACYANAGTITLGEYAWVDQVSTGNNDIQMNDVNGAKVKISRRNIVTYPNRPPHISSIQIF